MSQNAKSAPRHGSSRLGTAIQQLLREGLAAHLFSAAAAGVSTADGERVTFAIGSPSFGERQLVTTSSLFDLASLTKTYTAVAAMDLVDRGEIDLDAPVSKVLSVGAGPAADRITLRMLLRHTSGLPAVSEIWRNPFIPPDDRLRRVLSSELVAEPDRTFIYSCPGYVAIGALIEAATGNTLAEAMHTSVFAPLGLEATRFGPVGPTDAVATEYEPHVGRGLVRGEVHDELSWYLGGKTGNAGLFAPVTEVLTLAEALVGRGALPAHLVKVMMQSSLTPDQGISFGHGLGLRIGDAATMGSSRVSGHAGFTGTLWVIDPEMGWAATLLTNRVHPDRSAVKIAPFRRAFVDSIYAAML